MRNISFFVTTYRLYPCQNLLFPYAVKGDVSQIDAFPGAELFKELRLIARRLDGEIEQADGQIVEPEIAVFVRAGLPALTAGVEQAPRADDDLLLHGIVHRAGDEPSGDIAVIHPREAAGQN